MLDSDVGYLGWNEPRYAGKSITMSIEYPICEMAKDYNSAGLLITASDKLSKTYNRAIVDALLTNKELKEDLHTDWWLDMKKGREGYSAHEIFLKRTIMRREPSFMTAGIGTQIIGFHPDYIIVDDPIQTAEDRTGLRGQALQAWFNSVLIPMQPKRFIVVGTRKAPDDIYQYLQDLNIFLWSARAALKRIPEYEVYYEEEMIGPLKRKVRKIRILEKGLLKNPKRQQDLVYWPQRYTLEELIQLRETMGYEAFSGEMQNAPVPAEGRTFKKDWIKYYDYNSFINSEEFQRASLYSFLDPASGLSEWADYTAMVTIAWTGSKIYIIEVKFGRWTPPVILHKFRETYYKWKHWHKFPLSMGVETSFHQMQLLNFIDKMGLGLLPLVSIKPLEKKELRIDSLTSYFQREMVYVSREEHGYDEFLREYLLYDPEKSKKKKIKVDVIDCLQQCIALALSSRHAMLGVRYD